MMTTNQNAMIGLLLSSFPNFQSGDAESALTAYEIGIAGFEDGDVADAVRAFVQGRVPGHNMAFAPTAPQLAAACRRSAEARLDVASRNKKAVLQIEARDEDTPKNAESRRRVAEMVAKAVSHLTVSEDLRSDSAMLRRANARHDEVFAPTLRYTVGDPDAENGDMGGRKAS